MNCVQVSVLTIDTTATPPAPAEPFGVAHTRVVKEAVNEIVMFPSPGSGRRMPYENMT